MINVYYSTDIDNLRMFNTDDYITSLSSFEYRKDQICKITLPHPTVTFDSSILEYVSPAVGDFINIEIDGVIRFRGRISKTHTNSKQEKIQVQVDDLLQKLSDIYVSDIWLGTGYMSLTLYINSLPHSGYQDFRYETAYPIKRYISVRFLLKILLHQSGIIFNNISFNISGESQYHEYDTQGNQVDYEDLCMRYEDYRDCGKNDYWEKGSDCLTVLNAIISSIGGALQYDDEILNIIIPSAVPAVSDPNIIEEDYEDYEFIDAVGVTTSGLAAGCPAIWSSSDFENNTEYYPEEAKGALLITFPTFFKLGYITSTYQYGTFECVDGEHTFGEQVAYFYYGAYNSRTKTLIQTVNGVQFYQGFWYDSCSYSLSGKKRNLRYGVVL